MLTHRRLPASLSLVSSDLPVRTAFDTFVTLYQRAPQRFHILIDVPPNGFGEQDAVVRSASENATSQSALSDVTAFQPSVETSHRLLWIEVGTTRAIFTSQSKTGLSYRHMWERGTYGISRYWLNASSRPLSTADRSRDRMRLRNFTRRLDWVGVDRPEYLRLDYELWAQQLKLGTYRLELDIH